MAQKARPEAYGAGQLTPPILVRCFPFHRVRLRSFILNKRRVLYYVLSCDVRGGPGRADPHLAGGRLRFIYSLYRALRGTRGLKP